MFTCFLHVCFSFPLVYNYLTISAAGKEDNTVFAGVSHLKQEACDITCIWKADMGQLLTLFIFCRSSDIVHGKDRYGPVIG
jgi:hypothetical protein